MKNMKKIKRKAICGKASFRKANSRTSSQTKKTINHKRKAPTTRVLFLYPKFQRREIQLMKFTKLDYSNCLKYPEVANNKTLATALSDLGRENSKENHLLICQQIIGYLRCMYDLKIISAGGARI